MMNKIIVNKIKAATVQVVGNKVKEEGVSFATELTDLSDSYEFVKRLIENSFGADNQKQFTYVESVELNPVYNFVSKIFDDSNVLIKQSVNLATYLYNQSLHPNIKSGEFYVILVECQLGFEVLEALVMFKSEHKDAFLTTDNNGRVISVKTAYGTGIKKLDKGCLILNKKREEGFIVLTIDRTNSGNDAHYWTESFLNVINCNDDYHSTLAVADAFSTFLARMQKEESANRSELALAASRSKEVLGKSGESIQVNQLPELLFTDEGHKEKFQAYLESNDGQKNSLPYTFTTQPDAIKRKAMGRMNSIRLDNNFEIKILNGQVEMIREYDEEKGMNYYKLWFEKER